ncbi:hypothetical protein CRM22_000690 [Opisthorchis felineus]|uniref:Uncharacterized protein n=1 Tax=Opisthorchis felineus TaxID=147828 RepID=A0A4S2MDX1_OPIFE|nr:hypothetical protein CRM22_000690 [Opisthorchis felineus]TGZ74897.1 hypothetical protein CRM22_000690 [Opisthorchis felineus]
MNHYIIPVPQNDPRLFSNVSHAFSLVDLGKRLLEAAKNGDVEEVKNLMSSGAPFTTDWLGISPLHFAAMNGHLSSCEALLSAGISRDARTKVDRTPLHLAAQEGHADIVELLLRNGAEIEAKDMLRMTALHWAAERGHTPVVQMLMRFGADCRTQNKFELTPIDIAEAKGHTDARDAMLNTNYDMVSSVGRMAATNGDLANANAYILTDEETLVPAAPPADEVIVTATTVDELEETSNSRGPASIAPGTDRAATGSIKPDPDSSPSDPLASAKSDWDRQPEVDCTVDLELAVQDSGMLDDEAENDPFHDNPSVRSHFSDDAVPSKNDETAGRDVMLVETPDGDMLYVRQLNNTFGPEGIAIFTSTGEQVHSSSLMAQVIEALFDLPKGSASNGMASDDLRTSSPNRSPTAMRSPPRPVVHRANGSAKRYSPRLITPVSGGKRPKPDRATRQSAHAPLRHSSPRSVRAATEEDEDCAVITQLALFAEGKQDGENSSFRVEGIGLSASIQEICNWCLYNGIFVQSFASGPDFVVEIIHQGKTHILDASYDPETGTITFHRPTGVSTTDD